MDKQERVLKILEMLREEYPDFEGTMLKYENPVQLLVATILSAQSTDDIVNKITGDLFQKYETADDFAGADREELERLIYSSGYYRNKAKWIQECCTRLVEDFDSEVPRNIEDLTSLTGVGRKTANVVLSEAFGVQQGIAVDTHVRRLAKRLNFSNSDDMEKVEQDLMELVPSERWFEFSNMLIAHGRNVCEAKSPKCGKCLINDFCPSAFSFE